MKSYLLAALARLRRPGARAAIDRDPSAASLVDPKVAALRDDALDNDHYAWDIVEGLTTEVGQRLAATEAEARARDWAVPSSSRSASPTSMSSRSTCRCGRAGRRARRSSRPSRRSWRSPRSATAARPARTASPAKSSISTASMRSGSRPTARSEARSSSSTITWSRPRTASGYGHFGAPRRQGPTIAVAQRRDRHRRPLDRHRPSPQSPYRRPDISPMARVPFRPARSPFPTPSSWSASSSAAGRWSCTSP